MLFIYAIVNKKKELLDLKGRKKKTRASQPKMRNSYFDCEDISDKV